MKKLGFHSGLIFSFLCGLLFSNCGMDSANTIRMGCKNFTEQYILGEMMAELIEAKTDLYVDRNFNLGGTVICHKALINGEIDLYPEYTGTALTTLMNRETIPSSTEVFSIVESYYREEWDCEWLQPLGFDNTYALTVREKDAEEKQWKTISDLKPDAENLPAGFTAEFMERPDGYPGLKKKYELDFQSTSDLDPGLMYRAIAQKEVDVICAFATDGRIPAFNLYPLKDNLNFFPPYEAAPVVRQDALKKFPKLRETLNLLARLLDNETMQQLNFEVDENKRAPSIVAREFLLKKNLIQE